MCEKHHYKYTKHQYKDFQTLPSLSFVSMFTSLLQNAGWRRAEGPEEGRNLDEK